MKDKFIFYSKSADKAPGEGKGEYTEDPYMYKGLASFTDWRKILGNFYECNFVYEGRTYKTVEHALQAKKFQAINQDLFESFALESESALSKGSGLDARKMRKTILLKETELTKWDKEKIAHINNMHYEKFTQCLKAKEVLLATKDAELWHYLMRVPKGKNLQRWTNLETLRTQLKEAVNKKP
ncbi:NADAR family protein [Aureispira anguillae]|uniref:NADAR family protein n=1 Tax=Aureispira anguillae TaxID=2864201 RepID=A0A915YDH9_9BACT|nr:NADAR family protein [Aureispira anguillae]BDS11062.1 NADAR family protein [Aureispira anguillae]